MTVWGVQVSPYGAVAGDWEWNITGRLWRYVAGGELQTYLPVNDPSPGDGWVTMTGMTLDLPSAVAFSMGYGSHL